jgi:two-component system response regulator TctD
MMVAPGELMARVLVVEDDPALSRGLMALLKSSGHAAEWACDGETALRYIEGEPLSLLMLDIGLPGISGFQVIERLRASGCKTPILILTARDQVADRVRGLDLGADDYLLKPFNASELAARVRALLRREHGDPSPVVSVGSLVIDRVHATAEVSGRVLHLRPREWAVLACLSSRVGEVVPKKILLAEVFTYDDEVAPNALEVHVARLRRQLEPDGPAIKSMRGLGYMLIAS